MNDTVGIVIVSHSKDIAKGTADMVRQMVGSRSEGGVLRRQCRRRPRHQRAVDH